MSMPININVRTSTDRIVYIFNATSPSPIDGISIHIEPLFYSTDIAGYNETTNATMWLLEPREDLVPKVQIKVDDVITYDLTKNNYGCRVTNPIVYFRSGLPGHIEIPVKDDDGNDTLIQPLFSMTASGASNPWIETLMKQGFNNHTLGYEDVPYNDSIKIEIIINANQVTEATLYNNIVSCLSTSQMLIIKPTIFNKPLTSTYELLYQNTYSKYTNSDNYNIRF